ncbi:hypothetical protein EAF00_002577 [Botryotinia globosa]|nr:hypothetical protein EAF00_002577 [Botryotinia globosa]
MAKVVEIETTELRDNRDVIVIMRAESCEFYHRANYATKLIRSCILQKINNGHNCSISYQVWHKKVTTTVQF